MQKQFEDFSNNKKERINERSTSTVESEMDDVLPSEVCKELVDETSFSGTDFIENENEERLVQEAFYTTIPKAIFRIIFSLLNPVYRFATSFLKSLYSIFVPDVDNMMADNTFIRYFENEFGLSHALFSTLSAKEAAKQSEITKKFIMLFFCNEETVISKDYCLNLFSNSSHKDTLENNYILWACMDASKIALEVKKNLKLTDEVLAIYKVKSSSEPSLIFKTKEYVSPKKIFKKTGINNGESSSKTFVKKETSHHDETHFLISQQNDEYEKLLKEDLEKMKLSESCKNENDDESECDLNLSAELARRHEVALRDFENRETSGDHLLSSEIRLKIMYPDSTSSQVLCDKNEKIKRVVDHLFVSHPNMKKKFKLIVPTEKKTLYTYGDDESQTLKDFSITTSVRINMHYFSSSEDDSAED